MKQVVADQSEQEESDQSAVSSLRSAAKSQMALVGLLVWIFPDKWTARFSFLCNIFRFFNMG